MLTKSRKQPNIRGTPTPSSSPTVNHRTNQNLNGSGTCSSASELHQLNRSADRELGDQINDKDTALLFNITQEHNIQSPLIEHLLKLKKCEIVIVCDDSGSMDTAIVGTENTRWDELRSIVKTILAISVKFDSNGVDIYFLNRREHEKVKDPKSVDRAFAEPPSGYTPLVPVLEKIFQSQMARRGADKKLLVIVATDGEPTDENGNPKDEHDELLINKLKHLMEKVRNKSTTYVSFLLCTDEPKTVAYLAEWDRNMENVDVTDDFETETKKVRECQEDNNYSFTHGDYIVKAMVGAFIPFIDRLNEQKK